MAASATQANERSSQAFRYYSEFRKTIAGLNGVAVTRIGRTQAVAAFPVVGRSDPSVSMVAGGFLSVGKPPAPCWKSISRLVRSRTPFTRRSSPHRGGQHPDCRHEIRLSSPDPPLAERKHERGLPSTRLFDSVDPFMLTERRQFVNTKTSEFGQKESIGVFSFPFFMPQKTQESPARSGIRRSGLA
jgi:hypothetical protein